MSKDGRESHWRSLCESERPEVHALPDKMDDALTPLQRVLVLRSVRAERLLHYTTLFVSAVLGKKCVIKIYII